MVKNAESRSSEDLRSYRCREWWCEEVPNNEYIHANVARHLRCCGLGLELGGLLLDGRWTHVRGRIGGLVGLRGDFEELKKFVEENENKEVKDIFCEDVQDGFKTILKATELSRGRTSNGERALLFQLCGRLHSVQHKKEIVDMYSKSMEKNTMKPYLVPVNSIFGDLYGPLVMVPPLRGPGSYSPCGLYIAAAASNGPDIAVVDASCGDILQRLKGDKHGITCVTFCAKSTKIVSGSYDNTVILWKWNESVLPVQVLEGHVQAVLCVAMNRDGRRVISGSSDCSLKVWDADSGRQEVVIEVGENSEDEGVCAVAVCEKSRTAAVCLASGKMKVVNTDTSTTVFEHGATHVHVILCLALSPNGALLATGSRYGVVQVWETETWTRTGQAFYGHGRAVYWVAFSADGKRIVSVSGDGRIRVWSIQTGRLIGVSPKLHFSVHYVMFNGDGNRIVSGDPVEYTLRVWDSMLDSKCEAEDYRHFGPVRDVWIDGNRMRAVSGSEDRTVRLWDLESGFPIGTPMKSYTGGVRCVALSGDGQHVVSGSDDGSLTIWGVATLRPVGDPLRGHADSVWSVSFSFDGVRIVSGSRDGTVRIWDVSSCEQIGDALEPDLGAIDGVSESCDGRHIVARGCGGSVVWNRERRAVVWRSNRNEVNSMNEMSVDEAKVIVRSCGQQTPHVWPQAFPAYNNDVYIKDLDVYSNAVGDETVLGTLLSYCCSWSYDPNRKLLVAGLQIGAVAICKLIVE